MKSAPKKNTKSLIIKGLKELSESKEARRKVDESYFKELKGKEHWMLYILMYALDNLETGLFQSIEEVSNEQRHFEAETFKAIKEERDALIKVRRSVDENLKSFEEKIGEILEKRMGEQKEEIAKEFSNILEGTLNRSLKGIDESIKELSTTVQNISGGFSDTYKLVSHNQNSITKLGKKLDEISEDLSALDERIGIEISRIPGAEGAAKAMKELEKSIESMKGISGDIEKIKTALDKLEGLDNLAMFSETVKGLEKEIGEINTSFASLKGEIPEKIEGALKSADALVGLEDKVGELSEKMDSVSLEDLSDSLKKFENLGKMASQIEDVRKRLGSFEELGDFYGQLDDLRKKLENIRTIEDEMRKDMDVLRRLVGEFEEISSVTEMLGELSERVKKVEEFGEKVRSVNLESIGEGLAAVKQYGEKLDSLDIDSLKSAAASGAAPQDPEMLEKLKSLGALNEAVDSLKPMKEEVSALQNKVSDIEKKVDMILKSTNKHLDVVEKNLKAEIAKLKGENG